MDIVVHEREMGTEILGIKCMDDDDNTDCCVLWFHPISSLFGF